MPLKKVDPDGSPMNTKGSEIREDLDLSRYLRDSKTIRDILARNEEKPLTVVIFRVERIYTL